MSNSENVMIGMKAVESATVAIWIYAFLYMMHYNYETLAVWASPYLLVALFGAVMCCLFFSIYNLRNAIRQ